MRKIRIDNTRKWLMYMKLFIYGASGAGIEVYDMANRINRKTKKYSEIFLIDDFEEESEYYGTRRIHFSSCSRYMADEEVEFVIAVGEPSARKLLADRIKISGYRLAVLVDSTAIVSETATLSPGCIVAPGAIVSSKVQLDENCMIGYHAIIGHDAHVKRDTIVCPKATVGGKSIVGERCFLGVNSSMKQEVNYGNDVIVGMGAVVFRDVEAGNTVVGNPARITKGNVEHKVFI